MSTDHDSGADTRRKVLAERLAAVVDDRDPLMALSAARSFKEELAGWEAELARRALAGGATWETIGVALGVSRQAAWERLRSGIAAAIEQDREALEGRRNRIVEGRTDGRRVRG
ncbi:MAG TPA: hypothetical protein VMU63_06500 [Acidimicrobiales bacterium]|nr:hypothetical protein [Acidimicrobiales bacterium]